MQRTWQPYCCDVASFQITFTDSDWVYKEQKKFDSADRLTIISHCTNTRGSRHPHLRISAVLFQRSIEVSNIDDLTTQ